MNIDKSLIEPTILRALSPGDLFLWNNRLTMLTSHQQLSSTKKLHLTCVYLHEGFEGVATEIDPDVEVEWLPSFSLARRIRELEEAQCTSTKHLSTA